MTNIPRHHGTAYRDRHLMESATPDQGEVKLVTALYARLHRAGLLDTTSTRITRRRARLQKSEAVAFAQRLGLPSEVPPANYALLLALLVDDLDGNGRLDIDIHGLLAGGILKKGVTAEQVVTALTAEIDGQTLSQHVTWRGVSAKRVAPDSRPLLYRHWQGKPLSPCLEVGTRPAAAPGPRPPRKVRVEVYAKRFEDGAPHEGMLFYDLQTGRLWRTGANGQCTLQEIPGTQLNLVAVSPKRDSLPMVPGWVGAILRGLLAAQRFDIAQGTVIVPPTGLRGSEQEIAFQVPTPSVYAWLWAALDDLEVDEQGNKKRHVVVTISAAGKNARDDDGEAGATAKLVAIDEPRFDSQGKPIYSMAARQLEFATIYFGELPGENTDIIKPRLCKGKPRHTCGPQTTTRDGGVVFQNVPTGWYVIRANKPGVEFSERLLQVRADSPAAINVSPPYGPRARKPEDAASGQSKPTKE